MKLATFTKTVLASAMLAGVAASPLVAHAALVNNALNQVINEFEDTDVERIIRDGASVNTGPFAVNDVLQAILQFSNVNNVPITLAVAPPPYQLTAYSELLITAIQGPAIVNGVPSGGPNGAACVAADPICVLVLGPAAGDADGTLPAGVMANIYENNNNVLPTMFQVSPTAGITSATGAPLLTSVGIGAGHVLPDFWYATVPNNANPIGTLAALTGANPQVGQYVLGLSVIGPSAIPVTPDGVLAFDGDFHDIRGNGSAFGLSPGSCGNGSTAVGCNNADGWLLSSNTTIQFRIPEPGSIALLGVALAGAGWFRRRQRV